MSRIIFIFVFVEYVFCELYSYSYSFLRQIICYTQAPSALIRVHDSAIDLPWPIQNALSSLLTHPRKRFVSVIPSHLVEAGLWRHSLIFRRGIISSSSSRTRR